SIRLICASYSRSGTSMPSRATNGPRSRLASSSRRSSRRATRVRLPLVRYDSGRQPARRAAQHGRSLPAHYHYFQDRGRAVRIAQPSARWIAALATAVGILGGSAAARAQDLEPRAYSASPIGTNFVLGSYLRTTGSASIDPSLPISGLEATINTGVL